MLELEDDDAGVRWNSIAPKNDSLWTIVNSFYSILYFCMIFFETSFFLHNKNQVP